MNEPRPRVVITGVGPICGLGVGREPVWAAALAGRCAGAPISRFDTAGQGVIIGCEVPDFDPGDYVDGRMARRADRVSHLTVAAARLALADAGLEPGDLPAASTGAIIASGTGGNEVREGQHRVMIERGPDRISPFAIPHSIPNMPSALVAMELGLGGPVYSTCNACAAGTDAIGTALHTLRRGDAEVMLAGGADAMLTSFWVAAFDAMKVLSSRNDDPARAARPFDVDRDGFLIGEGGGVVVMELETSARARGAEIICEVAGFGSSADAHHISDPHPGGIPQSRAVLAAMADAGVGPEQVDYVSAHGGASQPGDPAEIAALRLALGTEAAARTAVSATKAMHGHCMGGAGGIEAILTALTVADGVIPPTINLTDLDPACAGVDHVIGMAREAEVDVALSASFGLGGHNGVLCFTRGGSA